MHPDELKARLSGVLAFPVTPFNADLELDKQALYEIVTYLVDSGVHALVACAGTGEFYSLTEEECRQVASIVIEAAGGQVPVIVGVGCSARAARDLAVYAQNAGADGVLVLPSYYIRPHDDGLFDYYQTIATAVDLGVIVYSRDWAAFTPDFVGRLAEIDNIVALKEGQGDLRAFTKMQDRFGDRLAWIGGAGDDMVPGYFSCGAQAYTSSIANFMPEVALELYAASCRGDFAQVKHFLRSKVNPIYSLRGKRRGYEVTMTKEAMNLLGLPGGWVRPPLPQVTAKDREELRGVLRQIGLSPVAPKR